MCGERRRRHIRLVIKLITNHLHETVNSLYPQFGRIKSVEKLEVKGLEEKKRKPGLCFVPSLQFKQNEFELCPGNCPVAPQKREKPVKPLKKSPEKGLSLSSCASPLILNNTIETSAVEDFLTLLVTDADGRKSFKLKLSKHICCPPRPRSDLVS
ncbi:hypothetical protein AVEN_53496-1 [Araneus ventricosus]|uniref:Uncharacterized protein n=1 Tax=Araneus ventricosus TaxID=182803 RepID=A0A4Y2AAP4_ARAVE|nr:hypothetical protein AVEN_53496-1 [Araneus ventricosus]